MVGRYAGRRGRKRKSLWSVKTFLLRRSNADFMPGTQEASFLSSNGFGEFFYRLLQVSA